MTIVLITLTLMVSAVGVTPAFADDETPPPPAAEEPTEPPVDVTEPSVAATEAPLEPAAPLEVPEEFVPAEDISVEELVSEAPESTEIVALDENGEPLPLASQDAAEVVAEADPKWCPEGVLPNGGTCSANFPTIAALLADMRANPAFYSQNGVIYFERATLTTYTSSFVLDDSLSSLGDSYDDLSIFNITLTGGWSGGTSASLPGRTVFGGPDAFIQVGTPSNPWAGNVTLNNFQIGDTTNGGVSSNNSLTVYTTSGDITLNNVDVTQQAGNNYTAYLQSQSGDITVGPSLNLPAPGGNSVFDGNNAGGEQNKGFSATTSQGIISISDTTFRQAIQTGSAYSNGATLSAPVVNLTNVTANANDGSGIYLNGTGSTILNIFGGTFNNNKRYGIEVNGSILNEHSSPTCTGNIMGCYNVTPNAAPTVVVNNVTVEGNSLGGWMLAFAAIGSASDAEDGTASVSCSPAIGSLLPLGGTSVSCTATDLGGLTTTASGTVTVVDTTGPSLSLPSDITVAATSPAGAVATFTVLANDIVSGTASVTCTPAAGSTLPLGTTAVNCSALDGSNNQSTGSFNVTVKDTGAPVLALPANISIVVHRLSDAVVTYSASATDFIQGSLPVTCAPASGSTFPFGTTFVNCSATDGAGNISTGSFSVTVDLDKLAEDPLFSVTKQEQDQLPVVVDEGNTFGSALKLEFFNRGPKDGVLLSFPIPASMKDATLVVMFWDGSQWVALSGGSVVGDYFVIRVAKPGTYILVGQ